MADPIIVKFQQEGLNELASGVLKTSAATEQMGDNAQTATNEFKKFFDEQGKGHLSLQADIRKSTQQLAELVAAGKIDDKTFNDAAEAIAKMERAANKTREKIKSMASETRGIDALSQGIRGATAVMEGLVGATALFGEKNKNLEQTLIKLNAVMLISNSLKESARLLTEENALKTYALAAAQKAYTVAVGTSTGALRAFRLAIAATGIGLLVLAIAELVINWDKLTDAIAGSNNELAKSVELDRQKLIMADEALGKLELITLNMKKNGVEEAEISKFKQEQYENLLAAYDANIEKQEKLLTANKKTQDSNNSTAKGYKAFSNVVFGINKAVDKNEKDLSDLRERRTALYKLLLQEQVNALDTSKEKIKKTVKDLIKDFPEGGIMEFILFGDKNGQTRGDSIFEAQLAAIEKRSNILIEQQKQQAQEERDIAQKSAEDKLRIEEELRDKRVGIATQLFNIGDTLANFAFQISQQRTEKELQQLEDKKRRGVISEKQYQKQLAAIKNEQAQKQHRADTIAAFLAVPKAVLSAMQSTPFFAWPIVLPIAAALATVQAAIISATPVPKFAKGGQFRRQGLVSGKRHFEGGINAELEDQEFVHSRQAVKHYGVQMLKDINALKFPKPMNVTMKNKPVYNSTNTLSTQELQWIGNYIKQGNDQSVKTNSILYKIYGKMGINNPNL